MDINKTKVEKYKDVIVRNLTPSDILPHLSSLQTIRAVRSHIHSTEKSNKAEAAIILVDNLIKSTDQGWYKMFLDSLKDKGYEILSRTLEGYCDVRNPEMLEKLLSLYYHEICDKVEAVDLLPDLMASGAFERGDAEKVQSDRRVFGNHFAILTLLDLVSRKRESWFGDLMLALAKNEYDYIVENIDPELLKAAKSGNKARVQEIADELASDQFHSGKKYKDCPSKMEFDSSTSEGDTEVKQQYTREDPQGSTTRQHSEEMDIDMGRDSRTVADENIRTPLLPGPSAEGHSSLFHPNLTIHDYDIRGERNVQRPQNASQSGLHVRVQTNAPNGTRQSSYCTGIDSSSGSGVVENELHHSSQPDHQLNSPNKRLSSVTAPHSTDAIGQKTQGFSIGVVAPYQASARGEHDGPLYSPSEKLRSVSPNQREDDGPTPSTERPPPIGAEAEGTSQNNPAAKVISGASGIQIASVKEEPLKLRPYQLELAEEALQGRNSIIVAPTGSGKTHVALFISQQHIQQAEAAEDPKIIFIVPTVALVTQQLEQYKKYVPELQSIGLDGDSDESLHMRLPKYDVFVLTPQILLNALQSGDVTSLEPFTLLIFDECHHTSKSHPYNGIMHCYFREKEEGKANLPQVVGLTASVGVGKTNREDRAIEHILKMCANLDSRLKVVQKEKASLQRHVHTPGEKSHEVQGRTDDPFHRMITEFMTRIEERMKNLPEIDKVTEIVNFRNKLEAPSEKGSNPYTGWVSGLKRPVARIYEQHVRRVFVACLKHLKIYNDSLFVNADCRTVDAWNYIKTELGEFTTAAPYKDATDKWLESIFYNDNVKGELQRICQDPAYNNPKLLKVKELILESYKKNPDLRAIVFCKTREMTQALKNWMLEDSELGHLNADKLVGSHSAQDRGGMTAVKQDDVIKFFRDGKHKVIIATTVAEEGLDIQKCSLVIRYQHVTNETARIQTKGRGRDEDSKYMVVAEREGGIKKEEINREREKLMYKAINGLRKIPQDKIESKIKELQREEQLKQKQQEVAKIAQEALKQKSRNEEDEYQLRCFKCDQFACFSSDIKCVNTMHMVVSEEFDECIVIEPHPKPVLIADGAQKIGKVFCKKCHDDWGITAIYEQIAYPIIKISSFVIITPSEARETCKKWNKAPFHVADLTLDDRKIMVEKLKMYSSS